MKRHLIFFALLALAASLSAQRSDQNYRPANDGVVLAETTLPVVAVTTNGQTIDRQTAIDGTLRITDTYSGAAQLQWWGTTSFTHQAKKPLLCREASGSGREWLLQALYADRSMLRAQLTTVLARQTMADLPQARYCELTVDGIYYGIYLLSELPASGTTMPMADYLLAAELAHDTECYRFNTSDEDATARTLSVGLLDTYMGYGNNYAQDGWRTDTWIYNQNATLRAQVDPWQVPAVWTQLTADAGFKGEVRSRWAQLRQTMYSDQRVMQVVDSLAGVLRESGALARDTEAWGHWGQRVWPNREAPASFDDELARMKTWLSRRLAWMDSRLTADEIVVSRGPLAIASGFNADVVAEAAPASTHVSADLDDNGFVCFAPALRTSGALPADGRFSSDVSGAAYQLGDYTANQVLRLGTKGATGTLTLEKPTALKQLYIVAMGGNGNGSYRGILHYDDGTETSFTKQTTDWSMGDGVLTIQRMQRSDGSVNAYQQWCLYEDSVALDDSRRLESVTFTSTSDLEDGWQPVVSIFALAGLSEQVISGIRETVADTDFIPVRTEYYDLQGRRMPRMRHGLNVVVEHGQRGATRRRLVVER